MLRAIETGAAPLIDGASGRQTLELITAIYKSASTGALVSLPMKSDDAFYARSGIQANATHFYEKQTSVENFATQTITVGSSYTQEK